MHHKSSISITFCPFWVPVSFSLNFPCSSVSKESACDSRNPGSIPVLGDPLEKEMATHFSILAWENPWIEEPVGYSPRVTESQTWWGTRAYCRQGSSVPERVSNLPIAIAARDLRWKPLSVCPKPMLDLTVEINIFLRKWIPGYEIVETH